MRILLVFLMFFMTACSSDLKKVNNVESTVNPVSNCNLTFEYDYSLPVKETSAVDNIYLDNSVFIGDSRTEVLKLAKLNYVHVISKEGIAINKLPITVIEKNENNEEYTAYDLLKKKDYQNVYIMLGYNELGWVYSEIFIENYKKIIDSVREIHPNANIYIQKIYMPTEQGLEKDEYASKEKIDEYNQLIKEMCVDKEVYYINTDDFFADENGYMKQELTEDGIHLKENYVVDYLDFIKRHVVKREDYEKNICNN